MLSSFTASVCLIVLAQSAATPQPSTNQTPSGLSAPPVSIDPATSAFTTDAGLILITIKPAMIEAYELVLRTLQERLSKDTDPARASATRGWRVFKAAESDAKGNIIYVHVVLPAVPGFDYRPSLLVDTLVADLAPEMLTNYRESIEGAPRKLSLTEFANMAVAPVVPPETKKPGD